MVKIKQQLVSNRASTSKGVNGRKYITIHETANTAQGADAQRHANLQSNGFTASWHWQVDDKQAIQSYPHDVRCWHGGDGTGNGNFNSIGIEICVNSDGDFTQAVKNAAELVKKIMEDEGITLSNVVQHNHWSGKDCPKNLRKGDKGINWSEFVNLVDSKEVDQVSKPKPPTTTKPVPTPTPPVSKPSTNTATSIVDYLASKGINPSFANRAKLAAQHGIKGYTGTAAQNTALLSKLRSGSVPNTPKPVPKGDQKTTSIVNYLKSINQDSTFANRAKLAQQHGVKNYSGTAAQNTTLLKKLRG